MVSKTPATPPITERLMWIGNTIFHQVVAVVGTFILWTVFYYSRPYSTFTVHAVLSTIAYVPLMAEAIVLFSNDNVWTQNIKRTTKYYFHGLMLFTSAVLVTIGIIFMIIRKEHNHFISIHAITGLLSWIFVLLSQVLGVSAAKAHSLRNIVRPVWIKFVHNLFGILGYVLGMVSLAYALNKSTFRINQTLEARQGVIVLIGCVTAWTLIAALKSAVEQLRSIIKGS